MAAVGRLLSVNVGGPREVPWDGKVIRTAIWKTPVTGARMVRRITGRGGGRGQAAGSGQSTCQAADEIDVPTHAALLWRW